uniref:Uncharacterized protein n=1 Tax=Kalanchoe fedtschenkoi TaxID=63787 RepID=A0A7N0U7E4_KALFE
MSKPFPVLATSLDLHRSAFKRWPDGLHSLNPSRCHHFQPSKLLQFLVLWFVFLEVFTTFSRCSHIIRSESSLAIQPKSPCLKLCLPCHYWSSKQAEAFSVPISGNMGFEIKLLV